MKYERQFSSLNPYESVCWEQRTAEIRQGDNIIFKQENIKAPKSWSQLAVNIVASKYFYGAEGTPEREAGVDQLVSRVADTISAWGLEDGYFDSKKSMQEFNDDLTYLLLNQYAAFNSPVWFNVGLYQKYGVTADTCNWFWDKKTNRIKQPNNPFEYPSVSACFIQQVDDTMDSIMDLARSEALLFKFGSGSGSNLSTLRASCEGLSGGGKPSGPISFMRVYDQVAEVVTSGGRCLAGTQCVYTDNGPQEVKSLAGRRFPVISYHPPTQQYEAKWATAWHSGTKEVLRITTDKGVFDVSHDHPLWTADRQVIRAEKLVVGTRLFACTINETSGKYLRIGLRQGSRNHRVLKVESLGLQPVFSVEVECDTEDTKTCQSGHNFVVWPSKELTGSGIVVSNTRRAALLKCLNIDHPDIDAFITCKAEEETHANMLVASGVEPSRASKSVMYQNMNISVRITDGFINAVKNDLDWDTYWVTDPTRKGPTYKARELWQKIATSAWECGDPGVQYDCTINNWNTIPNSGRIVASNPCLAKGTLLYTKLGWKPIETLVGTAEVFDGLSFTPSKIFKSGTKSTVTLTLSSGQIIKVTPDHKIYTEEGWVQAKDSKGLHVPFLRLPMCRGTSTLRPTIKGACRCYSYFSTNILQALGFLQGDGSINNSSNVTTVYYTESKDKEFVQTVVDPFFTNINLAPSGVLTGVLTGCVYSNSCVATWLKDIGFNPVGLPNRQLPKFVWDLTPNGVCSFLQGLYTANGDILTGSLQAVALVSTCKLMLQEVQLLLQSLGIKSAIYSQKVNWQNVGYLSRESYHLIIDKSDDILRFNSLIGFPQLSQQAKLDSISLNINCIKDRQPVVTEVAESDVCDVYDFTCDTTHMGVANGIVVHNCSEFLAPNNTACNLASINLMKFYSPTGFDYGGFQKAVRTFIIAQDILVDRASYPIKSIARNAHRQRQLGLGYTNFGALCMSLGLPYDSEKARNLCENITSTMTAKAYITSAELAADLGVFEDWDTNSDAMLQVIESHADNADYDDLLWDEAIKLGQKYGYRNSQVSLLAPTGTISFMLDCDTTGIEPDIALIKHKTLVGGGTLKLINHSVERGLRTLDLSDTAITKTLEYLEKHDSLVGCDTLTENELKIFATSLGQNVIDWKAHLKMMAAAQPFLSGAISKTVNMPAESTVNDIANAYMLGWELGLKSVAVYRDGSKSAQPLNIKGKDNRVVGLHKGHRERLPDTRQSITHKFTVGGHDGYLTVGLYPDSTPGELFISVAKEGSTLGGIFDCFGIAVSIALQYGVPLSEFVDKFAHVRFEPMGYTNNKELKIAKSIIDYIFRWLDLQFTKNTTFESPKESPVGSLDAPICDNCGGLCVRVGTCYLCYTCGTSGGCS